ncbi:hypothetical protein L249_1580 [Ophiocordyceps polyrhachis-furcata BCC 54312]|uniref:Uncharacterized protein n=1 Tax=Ophiocordyceps polyrhachis-furcata BCC 54312 TaxID=1330021 RepID=A0A367L3Z4_9HYPO|nr:hypothetical protein L249_1580 [Ophiocordyceps polyrhachis-furcata BCC 54312]
MSHLPWLNSLPDLHPLLRPADYTDIYGFVPCYETARLTASCSEAMRPLPMTRAICHLCLVNGPLGIYLPCIYVRIRNEAFRPPPFPSIRSKKNGEHASHGVGPRVEPIA